MPDNIYMQGNVGLIGRSGTLGYEAASQMKELGIGISTGVGIGGDPINGSSFVEILKHFEKDDETEAVMIIGEIGGPQEAEAAEYFQKHMSKPVAAYIAGLTAPPGRLMGHAGAIVNTSGESAAEKVAILQDAGIMVAPTPSDTGINYNEQKIKTARASIGLLVDDEVRIREITFMPNARIEYGKDLIDSSDAIVSYNVYPNTNYTLNIDKDETDNFRVGVGADIEVEGGWLFMADYERNQTESSGHENTLSMGISFQPNSTSNYSFLIINGNSSNRQIGLDFDKSLSDDWSVNASFEVAKISTSGYNNTVQFSTEMSF